MGFCARGLGRGAPSPAWSLSALAVGKACREGELCRDTRASRSSVSRSLASSSCSCCSPVVTVCFLFGGQHRSVCIVAHCRGWVSHFSSTVRDKSSTPPESKPNMASKSLAKFCAMVLLGSQLLYGKQTRVTVRDIRLRPSVEPLRRWVLFLGHGGQRGMLCFGVASSSRGRVNRPEQSDCRAVHCEKVGRGRWARLMSASCTRVFSGVDRQSRVQAPWGAGKERPSGVPQSSRHVRETRECMWCRRQKETCRRRENACPPCGDA